MTLFRQGPSGPIETMSGGGFPRAQLCTLRSYTLPLPFTPPDPAPPGFGSLSFNPTVGLFVGQSQGAVRPIGLMLPTGSDWVADMGTGVITYRGQEALNVLVSWRGDLLWNPEAPVTPETVPFYMGLSVNFDMIGQPFDAEAFVGRYYQGTIYRESPNVRGGATIGNAFWSGSLTVEPEDTLQVVYLQEEATAPLGIMSVENFEFSAMPLVFS